jgi:hypothetical protein
MTVCSEKLLDSFIINEGSTGMCTRVQNQKKLGPSEKACNIFSLVNMFYHTAHRFDVTCFVIMIISATQVYLHSTEDLPVFDVSPQHVWDRKIQSIYFSPKQTYTTEGAWQLSIQQRKCVFGDEIKLLTSDTYTYQSCMIQCRMKLARSLCKCVPFFYRKIGICFISNSYQSTWTFLDIIKSILSVCNLHAICRKFLRISTK